MQIDYILAIGSIQVCILTGDLECPVLSFPKVSLSYWNSGVSEWLRIDGELLIMFILNCPRVSITLSRGGEEHNIYLIV